MFTSIRSKLIASFAFIVLLVMALSSYNITKIDESADGFKSYREMARDSVLAGRVQANMLMVRMNVKDFLVDPSEKEVKEFNEYFDKTRSFVDKALVEIQKPGRAELVVEISEGLNTYKKAFEQVQSYMDKRNNIVQNVLDVNGPKIEKLYSAVKYSAKKDGDIEASLAVADGLRSLLLGRLYASKFIKSNAQQDMDRVITELEDLDHKMEEVSKQIQNPTRIKQLKDAHDLIITYEDGVKELKTIIDARNKIINEQLNVIGPRIAKLSEDVKYSIKADQDTIGPAVQQLNENLITTILIISLVVIVIGILIAIAIPKSIANGLTSIQDKLSQISSSGDFSIRADTNRQDEIGKMGAATNSLLNNIQSAIKESNMVVSAMADGDFEKRIQVQLNGELDILKNGINSSADSISQTMTELETILDAMNDGDFNAQVHTGFKGDFKLMMDNASSTMKALNQTIGGIISVMDEMQQGRFQSRVEINAKGDLAKLKDGVNNSLESIHNAMSDIIAIVKAQSEGDLTQQITKQYHGDLRTLTEAINTTSNKLIGVVSQAVQATNIVNDSSSEVSSGAIKLSQRMQQQAASLEETSATMTEMNSQVQSNTKNAVDANHLADEVQSEAKNGTLVMKQTIQAMDAIQESSHKIADIVSLIDGIAFQTNLLALNAAVEAARAGEHGRGFAVVAGEVRSLAQKSADAAKEIKTLIDETVERVNQGSNLASESGEMLNKINDSINSVAEMINQIAQASSEQAEGVNRVHSSITEIDRVTQENNHLVQDTSTAADTMGQQASSLSQDMSFFNTGNAQRSNPLGLPKKP